MSWPPLAPPLPLPFPPVAPLPPSTGEGGTADAAALEELPPVLLDDDAPPPEADRFCGAPAPVSEDRASVAPSKLLLLADEEDAPLPPPVAPGGVANDTDSPAAAARLRSAAMLLSTDEPFGGHYGGCRCHCPFVSFPSLESLEPVPLVALVTLAALPFPFPLAMMMVAIPPLLEEDDVDRAGLLELRFSDEDDPGSGEGASEMVVWEGSDAAILAAATGVSVTLSNPSRAAADASDDEADADALLRLERDDDFISWCCSWAASCRARFDSETDCVEEDDVEEVGMSDIAGPTPRLRASSSIGFLLSCSNASFKSWCSRAFFAADGDDERPHAPLDPAPPLPPAEADSACAAMPANSAWLNSGGIESCMSFDVIAAIAAAAAAACAEADAAALLLLPPLEDEEDECEEEGILPVALKAACIAAKSAGNPPALDEPRPFPLPPGDDADWEELPPDPIPPPREFCLLDCDCLEVVVEVDVPVVVPLTPGSPYGFRPPSPSGVYSKLGLGKKKGNWLLAAAAAAAAAAACCCWFLDDEPPPCCPEPPDPDVPAPSFTAEDCAADDLPRDLLPELPPLRPLQHPSAAVGSSPAAAIMAARLCASIPPPAPASPPSPARFEKRFMLFKLPSPPSPASPGMPPNGISSGLFFGSKLPSPGMLESKLAFSPARPGNCMLAAAAAAAAAAALLLLWECFFDEEDDADPDDDSAAAAFAARICFAVEPPPSEPFDDDIDAGPPGSVIDSAHLGSISYAGLSASHCVSRFSCGALLPVSRLPLILFMTATYSSPVRADTTNATGLLLYRCSLIADLLRILMIGGDRNHIRRAGRRPTHVIVHRDDALDRLVQWNVQIDAQTARVGRVRFAHRPFAMLDAVDDVADATLKCKVAEPFDDHRRIDHAGEFAHICGTRKELRKRSNRLHLGQYYLGNGLLSVNFH
uniref:Uncharacterized protein n=1 Tax=Anopheles coluzzii TaxID=1518534 RepID=A0A8W7PDG9_ANOCL